jgi:hypothetical protein
MHQSHTTNIRLPVERFFLKFLCSPPINLVVPQSHHQRQRESDGCPTFASAYVGRKRRGGAPTTALVPLANQLIRP